MNKFNDFEEDVDDRFTVKKQPAKVKEDKEEKEKKAVFLERTKEEKEADEAAKKAEIQAIEQKYDDKEKPELNPKWNGIVCGSCLQQIVGAPTLFEATGGEQYQEEPVNYTQCSECKSNEKPVLLFVQETEEAYIEVPRRSLDPEEKKK